ncbi:MAG: hypothetical protein WBH47_03745 [Streptosporangiaceae bacterium]
MAGLGPELGFLVISLGDWRARMQPQLDDILGQLRQAKGPRLLSGTSAAGQAALPPAAVEEVSPEAGNSTRSRPRQGQWTGTMGSAQPRHHRVNGARVKTKTKVIFIGAASSFVLGLFLIFGGVGANTDAANSSGPAYGTEPGTPLIVFGVIFILLSLFTLIGWVIVEVTKFSVAEGKKYSSWKKTLTPGERMAVSAAEAGLLWEAHRKFRDHNREQRARVAESAAHGAPDTFGIRQRWQEQFDAGAQQPQH